MKDLITKLISELPRHEDETRLDYRKRLGRYQRATTNNISAIELLAVMVPEFTDRIAEQLIDEKAYLSALNEKINQEVRHALSH